MSNDRLKFRAWDNTSKDIGGQVMLGWEDLCGLVEHDIFLTDIISGDHESLILMQWTGLYDRDGVEIYEGDIVQPQYNDIGAVEAKMYRDLGQYNVGGYKLDKCRIIGNVFESPELVGKVWNRA